MSRAEVMREEKINKLFIGDASQTGDKCLLVRNPSRQHDLAMETTLRIAKRWSNATPTSPTPSSWRRTSDSSARGMVAVGQLLLRSVKVDNTTRKVVRYEGRVPPAQQLENRLKTLDARGDYTMAMAAYR